jgi:hypothetical protein
MPELVTQRSVAEKGAHMTAPAEGNPVLDHQGGTRRIFIVHLRLDADPERGAVSGRVQHVSSGDATHFESVDELVAFLGLHVAAASE